MERAHFILDFWLGPEAERDQPAETFRSRWFGKGEALDDEIRRSFGEDIERAAAGEYDDWLSEPRGRLAVVILLDQFTRNVARDTEAMYQHDERACGLSLEGLQVAHDHQLRAAERQFLYMPLMHSEVLAHQERCVRLFEALAKEFPHMEQNLRYAQLHRDIVQRFGRFPHRNALLGRTSTGDEVSFLHKPGSSF